MLTNAFPSKTQLTVPRRIKTSLKWWHLKQNIILQSLEFMLDLWLFFFPQDTAKLHNNPRMNISTLLIVNPYSRCLSSVSTSKTRSLAVSWQLRRKLATKFVFVRCLWVCCSQGTEVGLIVLKHNKTKAES